MLSLTDWPGWATTPVTTPACGARISMRWRELF